MSTGGWIALGLGGIAVYYLLKPSAPAVIITPSLTPPNANSQFVADTGLALPGVPTQATFTTIRGPLYKVAHSGF